MRSLQSGLNRFSNPRDVSDERSQVSEAIRRVHPRIGDVARHAGVSKTAVSFAFNRPERLSPETVTRIRDIAETLGYRPNPVARLLTQRQTRSIGIMTPQALHAIFANPFFGAFSEGVALVADEAGYDLHFIAPDRGSLAHAMDRAIVDGLIVVGLHADHPDVGRLRGARIPMVLVDSTALPGAPTIRVDDEGGAAQAAAHILDLGHRDILIIANAPQGGFPPAGEQGVGPDRLRGYARAFHDRGLPFPVESLVAGRATFEGGAEAFRDAWAAGRRPTAVIAMSDAIAIGVMSAARSLDLPIPATLSIVGFDDLDIASQIHPALTTVRQPIRTKGREAVRLLLGLIEHGEAPADPPSVIETHLVIRDSTGPAPRLAPSRGRGHHVPERRASVDAVPPAGVA